MAKHGFRVIDSDIHVVEPKDLFITYRTKSTSILKPINL